MTRFTIPPQGTVAQSASSWPIRHARGEGPQHVALHGRDAVVDAEAYRRLTGARTGQLVEVLQASPHQDIDIEPSRSIEMPVRDVEL